MQAQDNSITHNKEPCQVLPLSMGDSPIKRLTQLYILCLTKKLGAKPVVSYAITGRIFKDLLKHYNEIQLAALLIAHFNYSPKYKPYNQWLIDNLKTRLYPIEIFRKEINTYIGYLIHDRGVDIDNLDEINGRVYAYLDTLTN